MAADPHQLFEDWFAEARAAEPNDPEAMALATADADGRPSVRMVLLKGHDARGFAFYTNEREPQGRRDRGQSARRPGLPLEVAAPPGPHRRADRAGQRGRGRRLFRHPLARCAARRLGVGPVAPARQPRRLRGALRAGWSPSMKARTSPARAYWRGYRLVPDRIEFWTDRPHRLHERRLFTSSEDGWSEGLLYP